MDHSEALKTALRVNGMRDEEAAVASNVSVHTIINIKYGRSARPQRLVFEALSRAIPGYAELVDGMAALVDGRIVPVKRKVAS